MSVLSGLSKSDFKTASDGLLELSEERLRSIMRTEPITDVYHVEQTPFARSDGAGSAADGHGYFLGVASPRAACFPGAWCREFLPVRRRHHCSDAIGDFLQLSAGRPAVSLSSGTGMRPDLRPACACHLPPAPHTPSPSSRRASRLFCTPTALQRTNCSTNHNVSVYGVHRSALGSSRLNTTQGRLLN
ncbi:hypothetical protein RR48_12588 [Papilio machaon]|uniref:Uncharacterized protein n=1 Tax=Papilio machaon TaxID=76193 RepID=A0A194RNJ2_PAPMA|nr:hypothetical protein RR48_12588 [Papilio machaon]